MDELDDAELLCRYAGDHSEEAFAELASRHLNLVYRSALRQTNGDAYRAQDVAQTVFTQLARKAGKLRKHPRLVGWLYSTTHFVTSAMLRSERRRQVREKEANSMQETSYDPSSNEGEGWNRVRPVLDEIMRGLSRLDREAVLLHYFEGRPFAEVGAKLSLREDAARMRVSRALEKMRLALARRGVISTTTALSVMLVSETACGAPAGLVASVTKVASLAAASTGPAAGLLHFMNASKIAASIAAGVGIFAGGTGIYFAFQMANQIDHERAQIVSADGYLVQIRSRLAAEAADTAKLEQERVRLEKVYADLRQTAKPAVAKGDSVASQARIAQELMALAKNPQLETAFLLNRRSNLRPTYSALYQQLKLTPEQVQEFETGLMKYEQAAFDVGISALDQGVSPLDPAIMNMGAKYRADLGVDLQGIVTVAQLDQYELNRAPAIDVTSQLKAALHFGDSPLTEAQSTSLIQLVVSHTASGSGQIDWDSVTARASDFLSPAQISLLGAVQAKLEYKQAYQRAISTLP